MKKLAIAILLALIVSICHARPVTFMSYSEMAGAADFIVIATPTVVKATERRTVVPGLVMTDRNGESAEVPAVWVETSFAVLATLKGGKETGNFVLLHLRETLPPDVIVNGPQLMGFDPARKRRYLLFLRREANGRFSPVCGQVEPATCIKDLGSSP